MITISLCMIVKNEEEVLERCLESVADLVDEINIIDTGSTDKTVEIAKKYTDRVFFFQWTGKFKDARNESFKYATKDYIFYLDADDVLLESDRKKFAKLKASLHPDVDAVSMFYHAGVDEYNNVTLKYRRNRLLKTSKQFVWKGDCHNYLEVSGNIINSDIAVTHKKNGHSVGRNLSIYEKKIANGDEFVPRDYFYYANELRENGHYEKAILNYTIHIDHTNGWIEDKVYSCLFRADCYNMIGKSEKALASMFESFNFSKKPRAEACCRIGYHFQKKREFEAAVYWYDAATNLKPDPNQWSFSYPAYSTWYPHLQLCVCYYNLQDLKKSYEHNEKARKYRPQDERILFNKKLIAEKLGLNNG
ncbi:glycosyltransferase family 2 protein [Virgibacillus sp. 179-BFC.A HS]|uniref:Glycosyltransferase family 2 protein n=1 Tax=Tigheibacillus jepli TaxID=3035914 RepID=A0ABU5CGQ7_9BACI|nr:glycosyltransferase family 2 protein [Virgibacillus sp. 179-BFC.A HS]MDY0405042.1 glycosyltransferase family 2 protein [Virgibacillus sp. 179-BFC.A HS]